MMMMRLRRMILTMLDILMMSSERGDESEKEDWSG